MLLPGDWVEVRSASEILATLDAEQSLDGLHAMPEMLASCGRRYRVRLRAEKTCVHPPVSPFRRLAGAVVLDGVRCDGSKHGGCQLGCMIFWKEAWLKRVDDGGDTVSRVVQPQDGLLSGPEADRGVFVCQATELMRATQPGEPLWSPAQYVRYVRNGTFTPRELCTLFARPLVRRIEKMARGILARTPAARSDPPNPLALQPGDWVEVRSREEIAQTLDARGMQAGLWFGGEMHTYCGMRLQVQSRAERIIDESSGRIRPIHDTVILDGAICDRYFGCARGMPLMWREVWLRRIDPPQSRG